MKIVSVNILHKKALSDLSFQYFNWRKKEVINLLHFDPFENLPYTIEEYSERQISEIMSYKPPEGEYFLLEVDGSFVGMGGIQRFKDSIGEIIHLYVLPQYRQKGFGRTILKKLIEKGIEFGFRVLYLETALYMNSAHLLYESFGFFKREKYPSTKTPPKLQPYMVYMEKKI